MQMYRRDVKSFPSLRHTERSFSFGFPKHDHYITTTTNTTAAAVAAAATLNVLIASPPTVEFPKRFIYVRAHRRPAGPNGKRPRNNKTVIVTRIEFIVFVMLSLLLLLLYIVQCLCLRVRRANDERVGDINRALNYDQKARDLTSQNGKYDAHSCLTK